MSSFDIIDLNVGGVHYTTTMATLTRYPHSNIAHTMARLLERGWRYAGEQKDKEFWVKFNETEPDRGSFRVYVEQNNRVFIDRDGALFRFVLDFLRQGDKFTLPERFVENERLSSEAEFYGLPELSQVVHRHKPGAAVSGMRREINSADDRACHKGMNLPPISIPASSDMDTGVGGESPRKRESGGLPGSPVSISSMMITSPGLVAPQLTFGASQGQTPNFPLEPGSITIGYRGTFAFGRDGGMADVKFRKLLRILVAGRVQLCKEVFGDTLNESRDPDRGGIDRYTSRFFLKHVFLEQAFDMLYEAGFRMVGSCGSGTNSVGDSKPGMDSEESKWLHYNEFVFVRL